MTRYILLLVGLFLINTLAHADCSNPAELSATRAVQGEFAGEGYSVAVAECAAGCGLPTYHRQVGGSGGQTFSAQPLG